MTEVINNRIREALVNGSLLHNLVCDVSNERLKKDIVVDVGDRDGGNLILLEHFGVKFEKCYVVDITSPVKRFGEITYLTSDLNKCGLPLDDNSVDLILAIEVIEHILNTDFFLSEIKRVLQKNGTAIITTPNLAWYPNIFLLSLGYQPLFTETSIHKIYGRPGKEVVGHLRLFTYKCLREMLIDNGFKIVKYKSVQTGIIISKNLIRILDKLLTILVPHIGCDIYTIVRK